MWTCSTFFALFVFRFDKLLFFARMTKIAGVQAILRHCYGGYYDGYNDYYGRWSSGNTTALLWWLW